jgi:hypothetical protein
MHSLIEINFILPLIWVALLSPRGAELFGNTQMLRSPSANILPPTANEVTRLTAYWGASPDATGYELTYWTSTFTNTLYTSRTSVSFTVTNLFDDRVFATITATNDYGETALNKIAHWPPYPADRMTITAVSGSLVQLETSINLKQWSASGTTPLTVSYVGSRRYYRPKGLTNAIITRPFNPLNE